jgi:hypothetical protein
MKTALNENHSNQKLNDFFTTEIEKEKMALYIRRLLFTVSKQNLENNEDGLYKNWISDGYYWLNEFAETIDPYLEKGIN